jgi:hypothetical protein
VYEGVIEGVEVAVKLEVVVNAGTAAVDVRTTTVEMSLDFTMRGGGVDSKVAICNTERDVRKAVI